MSAADAELDARGYPAWFVRLLRAVAAPGLWWQVAAWEWGSLGAYDVFLGYSALFVIASPFVAMLSNLLLGTFLWGAVPLVAGLVSFVVAWLGLDRRRRSRGRDPA